MNLSGPLTLMVIGLFINSVGAQSSYRDGFVVTLSSDTIYGELAYQSNARNYQSCIFKKGVSTTYLPNQIIGFGYLQDKYFTSTVVSNAFVEVLVSGELSLYKLGRSYFIKKNDGEVTELVEKKTEVVVDGKVGYKEDNRWRGLVSYLIGDCLSNPAQLVESLMLKEKPLTKLVIKYNTCRGSNFVVYKESKPWTKVDVGISAGLINSTIKTSIDFDPVRQYTFLDESYGSTDVAVGLMASLYSPRLAENIALQGEVFFTKAKYSTLVLFEGTNYTEYNETYIDLSTLSIPLSIKYTMPGKKYRLSTHIGVSVEYVVDASTRLLTEVITSEVVDYDIVSTLPERKAFDFDKSSLGYWGGVEVQKSLRRFNLGLSLRYFFVPKINFNPIFTANNNRISFNIFISTL